MIYDYSQIFLAAPLLKYTLQNRVFYFPDITIVTDSLLRVCKGKMRHILDSPNKDDVWWE